MFVSSKCNYCLKVFEIEIKKQKQTKLAIINNAIFLGWDENNCLIPRLPRAKKMLSFKKPTSSSLNK